MKIVNRKSKVWFVICGVLILSAVSASWMLSAVPLENHECFVSVTAREMLQSHNWIMPTFNGQPRLQKTPLSYWLVAGLAKITGRVDEFTARAPSAVFAFLSAVAILYFVSRWLSFRVAAISTAVWVTSLGYIRYSHNARPEMLLTFFITLCLLSFYSAITAQSRRRQIAYMVIFWVSFGLGNLAKGPVPVPLVLIPLVVYVVVFRRPSAVSSRPSCWKLLPKMLPIAGPLIFLAILLPWPLAVAHRVNWDLVVWKHEFIDRFFGEYVPGHHPLYYYLGIMFVFVVPWVAFLPMALAAPFYRVWDEKRHIMQFLWIWFVVGLAFTTISVGKRQHYIMPLMPAMAILIGILLEDMVFARKAYAPRFARSVLKGHVIAIIVGAVSVCVYLVVAKSQFLVDAVVISIVTILTALIVAILFSKGKPAAACGAIFSGIVVWIMIFYAGFSTVLDVDQGARDFAKKVARIVPPSDRLVAYPHVSTRFVQYFGKVVPEIQDKSLLYERYEQGDWVVCTFDHLDELAQEGRLREVYFSERANREAGNIFGRLYYPTKIRMEKEDAGGALFHKSATVVEDDPILPVH